MKKLLLLLILSASLTADTMKSPGFGCFQADDFKTFMYFAMASDVSAMEHMVLSHKCVAFPKGTKYSTVLSDGKVHIINVNGMEFWIYEDAWK